MALTLLEILKNVVELTDKHDFSRDPKERFKHLRKEVDELEAAVDKLLLFQSDPTHSPTQGDYYDVGEEIWDVIWNACAVGLSLNLDVEKYCQEKMKANSNRDFT